jgi:hypothetical protein
MNEQDTYRTNDMGLVAYFYYHGLQEHSRDWDDGVCWWVFKDNEILNTLFQRWIGHAAEVEPRRYNSAYSKARRSFYEDKRSQAT